MAYEKVAQDLISKISSEPGWLSKFDEAIKSARSSRIQETKAIHTLENYYAFLNELILWDPSSYVKSSK
ncbi:hypothetical protein G7Y89_g8213 [Cudoniella acicularis]|uniref:Uncharacterized protein n=1 Tax=Cudoniella acicularis TaxID=354080 RepID=A0A8H4RH17_9HELO|nr:hypothetical protein G7Y89_g8213 [Cudoniella acicularis]